MPNHPMAPPIVHVPYQFLSISPSAYSLAVYAALAALGACRIDGAELCLSEIAAAARIGHRTARRELRWLTQAGWLKTEYTPGSAIVYRLALEL
jgi:transcription initiation factor TFIIIB Brf1 subunit/transcription initiation factor TFIIB